MTYPKHRRSVLPDYRPMVNPTPPQFKLIVKSGLGGLG